MTSDTLLDVVRTRSRYLVAREEERRAIELGVSELVSGLPERFELPYVDGGVPGRGAPLGSLCEVHDVRGREPGGGALLRLLRGCARGSRGAARAAQGRHGPLLRRRRLDRSRRAPRPGGAARGHDVVLRGREGCDRAARRHAREVHRRRGHGRVRRARRFARTTRFVPCAPPRSCATRSRSTSASASTRARS